MSKALGCKRVHDDRIAGVTFEENASRNALIVNEEYAWVGNPFSAPEGAGKTPPQQKAKILVYQRYARLFLYSSSPVEAKGGKYFTP